MNTSDPNHVRDLYELYALGLLEEPEKSLIDEELKSGSPEAKKRLREAMENNAFVMANVPLAEPPARLRERVLAVAGVEKRSRGWMGFWAAAVAGFTVCFVLVVQSRNQASELASTKAHLQATLAQTARTNTELARARHILSFLNAVETKVVTFGPKDPKPPRGRILLNPERGVLLIASNLPPAPAGKIYEMWIIRKGVTKPDPAGLFQTDANGNGIHLQEGAVPMDATIAVTLEPEAGSDAPTTTPLFAAGA